VLTIPRNAHRAIERHFDKGAALGRGSRWAEWLAPSAKPGGPHQRSGG
jgi:hypothetical protein